MAKAACLGIHAVPVCLPMRRPGLHHEHLSHRQAQGLGEARRIPRQHPQRQKAIVIVGRDASGERVSSVVQTFTRRGEDHPVWEELAMASYNPTPETGLLTASLLDRLFDANQAGCGTFTTGHF